MKELSRVATELDNSQTEYWLDLLHETKSLDDKMLTAAIKKLKE